VTSLATRGNLIAAPDLTRHRLTAFGLDVESDWPLTGSTLSAPGSGTRLTQVPPECMESEWLRPAETVFEPAYPDGRRRFAVERDDVHYRLWFSDEGRYLVTTDGVNVVCESGAVAGELRERILFAQVLPFAAALQGFEILHASAVCVGGRTVAFAGASGSGKTSLATRLALRGRAIVTDDVLALERRDGGLICHAGPPLVVLAAQEPDTETLGSVVAHTDKVHIATAPPESELALGALFYLERGEKFEVSPLNSGDPERALASFFAPYLVTASRLRRHLEIAGLLSETVPQFRVTLPHPADFDAVLDAIEPRLR
jgi:hypothetical protein